MKEIAEKRTKKYVLDSDYVVIDAYKYLAQEYAAQTLDRLKDGVEFNLGDFNAETEFQLGYQRAIEDILNLIEEVGDGDQN